MKKSHTLYQILLAGALSAQVACVDAAESIQILQNQVAGEGCVVGTDKSTFQARGRIDVNATGGYLFTPLVENSAVSSQSATRRVFVEGANVDIEFPGGEFSTDDFDAALVSFKKPFSGSIDPGASNTFAFEVISKKLLDDMATAGLAEGSPVEVIAKVEIVGTMDGSGLSSNVFSYPIEVCNGCLTNVVGDCTDLPTELEIRTGGTCQTLQDGVLDCCVKSDETMSCPAVAEIVPEPV